jgi:hypothetical protein
LADYSGKLAHFVVSTRPPGPAGEPWPKPWSVDAQIDGTSALATTDSRIVLAVLETALLKRTQWDVELSIGAGLRGEQTINRVRVQDDRIDFCKGSFDENPKDTRFRPFTPTAFADENPKKWGFFFYNPDDKNCREYKGIDLGVYAILEWAWYEARTVVLTLDAGLIVAAKIA